METQEITFGRECCKVCKFWKQINIDGGICRRYPPIKLPEGQIYKSAFPQTSEDLWCGEFKRMGKLE